MTSTVRSTGRCSRAPTVTGTTLRRWSIRPLGSRRLRGRSPTTAATSRVPPSNTHDDLRFAELIMIMIPGRWLFRSAKTFQQVIHLLAGQVAAQRFFLVQEVERGNDDQPAAGGRAGVDPVSGHDPRFGEPAHGRLGPALAGCP